MITKNEREMAKTIKGRRDLYESFSDKIDQWFQMSNDELLKEAQKSFANITTRSSFGLLRYLIKNEATKFIGENY